MLACRLRVLGDLGSVSVEIAGWSCKQLLDSFRLPHRRVVKFSQTSFASAASSVKTTATIFICPLHPIKYHQRAIEHQKRIVARDFGLRCC